MNDQTKNEYRVTGILFLIFLFNAFVLGSFRILDLLRLEYKGGIFYEVYDWLYILKDFPYNQNRIAITLLPYPDDFCNLNFSTSLNPCSLENDIIFDVC